MCSGRAILGCHVLSINDFHKLQVVITTHTLHYLLTFLTGCESGASGPALVPSFILVWIRETFYSLLENQDSMLLNFSRMGLLRDIIL